MPTRHKNPATLAANVTENIAQIRYGEELFILKTPMDLEVKHEGGHTLVTYRPLELTGYGEEEAEALESFADQFGSTWHSIALADDAVLTAGARRLKRAMLKLVARVE